MKKYAVDYGKKMNFVNSESEFSDGSDYDRDVVVKFLCVNE
jgi:hypothetical protein